MHALRRIPQLLRRPLARLPPRRTGAVLLCLAAAAAAWALVPRTAGHGVLVAAHDLTPGQVLARGDLRMADYPAELIPQDALSSPAEAVDAVVAGGHSAGTPLTSASVLAPEAAARPEGTLLVPVVFGDGQAAATIRPGHRLRVYAAVDPLMDTGPPGGGGADGSGSGPDGPEQTDTRADEGADGGVLPGVGGPLSAGGAASGALVDDAAVAAVQAQGGGLGQGAMVVTLAVTERDAAALARASGSHLSFALLN
ncbi:MULTISPECIES: SAF domain-containing protein [Brevibacterium]|uniref:SAF domain-containing protein n=1 Tax=Brevibacterium TaxID=1696 RepID=UPI0025C22282|nr:SAF domain-containing protein [Brevibacterium sp.]